MLLVSSRFGLRLVPQNAQENSAQTQPERPPGESPGTALLRWGPGGRARPSCIRAQLRLLVGHGGSWWSWLWLVMVLVGDIGDICCERLCLMVVHQSNLVVWFVNQSMHGKQ